MKILVTGGAGYIGSFMTKKLLDSGNDVVVIDSLERGKKDRVDTRATFIEGNLLDKDFIRKTFSTYNPTNIIHFAGYISMGESMHSPTMYFENNIHAVINILESVKSQPTNFIFSSTAGVYGNPTKIPIPEDHSKNPTNPYGESKYIVERILPWYREIYRLNYVCLRYFNAAGAALDGSMGENHDPETHIIPKAIDAVIHNTFFFLFGEDYNTPDGTCIRDYIHVLDLVEAHILALEKLQRNPGGYAYNVGTGRGHSNREVLAMLEKVTGKKVSVVIKERRLGDTDMLIADSAAITKDLGFTPQYSDLKTIVTTAWQWHKRQTQH